MKPLSLKMGEQTLVVALLLLAVLVRPANALEIRNNKDGVYDLPKPTPKTVAAQFGYTEAQASAMMDLSQKERWSQVPPNPNAWNGGTYDLRRRMANALGIQGFDLPLANVIINVCKVYARDPRHCVVFASAISCAESTCGQNYDSSNAIFGIKDPKGKPIKYTSRTHAVVDWVKRYNENWYVANEGVFYSDCLYPNPGKSYLPYCDRKGTEFYTSFFYSYKAGFLPASHYCLSESGSSGHCPNGYTNSKAAYIKVKG